MKTRYEFNPEYAFGKIEEHWKNWADRSGAKKFILGMSGGKDSTIVAGLAARIFGPENIYGVMMPCGVQKDQSDAARAIAITGIVKAEANIGKAFEEMLDAIAYCGIVNNNKPSVDTRINLPPRLRMAMLFGIGQSIGAFVLNTDNLSERITGYSTFGGDGFGSYAPIQDLTVTEVLRLGDWLGLPHDLVHKKPGDGLQEDGDEDRLGLKYADLDNLIRTGNGSDDLVERSTALYIKNRFKTDVVCLPGPTFGYPNGFWDGTVTVRGIDINGKAMV